jgi:hypothetical protein
VLAAVVGAVVAVYLPHLVSVGSSVLGYLPGYLKEEGYGTGSRFALLTCLVPLSWAPVAAVAIMAVVAAVAARCTHPRAPWHSAAVTVGIALVLTSPTYTWYALLLVVLVGLGARVEWLAVAALGYVAQYATEIRLTTTAAQRLGYGTALMIVVIGWSVRRHWGARRVAETSDAPRHLGAPHGSCETPDLGPAMVHTGDQRVYRRDW